MRIIILAIAALALSGCNGTGGIRPPTPEQQTDITSKIKAACVLVNIASAGFDAYAKSHPTKIDSSGLRWKNGVMNLIAPVCINPTAAAAGDLTTLGKVVDGLIDFIQGVERAPVP